ncbi:monooxygenase FAD-binding [Gloeothece citriformis PCC 7424]|uniref:Monooxygenase FAD-binding n=1 Tax=Gloeothece citriformis (strain PCC 7424) TaxID=65393 RepID=B7KK44_GLOC7|nr:FAD-dependent monooxygenase [Gloeothece citriformis]ACK70929.1 monooxygenase FAD-binding [Gloeothece citriformis PCC 7424]
MTPSSNLQENILIVGAGPVGLTLAACLVQYGIPCRIIDKASRPSQYSKALGIFPRTLEVFESLGIINPILEAGKQLQKFTINAQQGKIGSLYFDTVKSPYPFVLSLPQSKTERILREYLAKFGVNVEQNVELVGFKQEDSYPTVHLHNNGEEETCQVGWLIGCDGSRSQVREGLGVPFVGERYQETFALADIKLEGSLSEHEATVFYHLDGVLALFPLPGGWFRVIANLPQNLGDDDPTLEEMQAIVNTRSSVKLKLSDPIWISKFHISRRKVKQYRTGRVFLAGDAAHIHSPAGGQGMNTGIQDAHNLAWKLAFGVMGLSPLSLLDSYEIEREPIAAQVLQFTDIITRVATVGNPLAQSLRNVMMSVGMKLKPIAIRGANTLAEVNISYRHSPIVADYYHRFLANLHPNRVQGGDRAPDGLLYQRSGQSVRIFELLDYKQYSLLLYIDQPITKDIFQNWVNRVKASQKTDSKRIKVYWIFSKQELTENLEVNDSIFIASDESIFSQYYQGSCLYLIRPDGYVGFCSSLSQWEKFKAYLSKVFC